MWVQVLLAAGVLLGTNAPQQAETKMEKKLWVSISVNSPIFDEGNPAKPLVINFVLVNDGDKTVNPDVEASQLMVNGRELERWPFIIANGIRDDRWEALPPGEYLNFTYGLSGHFREPGIYRVSWRSKDFRSPEIIFRILPKRVK
jgi:hypothetical protein